ncbi:MAG: hypothetical protein V2I65_12040 [Paracoccaceae bacterium]|jgi:hypothetical protein|nr:hypothetical protein [Paracoccaceae bacterium]
MSPPEHHTAKEARRHVPALVGIAVALGVAAVLIAVVLILPRLPADEQATPVPAPDGAAIEATEDEN